MIQAYWPWLEVFATPADYDTRAKILTKVGRCRVTVSKPVLKAPLVSALETKI